MSSATSAVSWPEAMAASFFFLSARAPASRVLAAFFASSSAFALLLPLALACLMMRSCFSHAF